jgi:hypothetical protein
MDNRTVDHGAMDNGTLGHWKWENRPRGQCTMGQWDFGPTGTVGQRGAMGQWDSVQWDNGQVNNGHVDNGQCHNGQWDKATIGPWDNRQWDIGAMSNEQ